MGADIFGVCGCVDPNAGPGRPSKINETEI